MLMPCEAGLGRDHECDERDRSLQRQTDRFYSASRVQVLMQAPLPQTETVIVRMLERLVMGRTTFALAKTPTALANLDGRGATACSSTGSL